MGIPTPKLTREKMENRRFRRTELAICEAALKCGGEVTEIVTFAGVSRATFYYHHEAAERIVEDCREYILAEYQKTVLSIKKEAKLRTFYLKTLFFVLNEREFFLLLHSAGETKIYLLMFEELKNKFFLELRISDPKVFKICQAGLVMTIILWGDSGFLEEGISNTLDNMMLITALAQKLIGRIK